MHAQPVERMSTAEIKDKLWEKQIYFDRFSRKGDIITIRRSYYYRHGMSEDVLAAQVAEISDFKVIEAKDEFAHWPKQSFWMVKFEVIA